MKDTAKNRVFGIKLIAAIVFVAALLMLLMPIVACSSEEGGGETPEPKDGVELTVNYFRGDEGYAAWSMWLWPTNAEGKEYKFDKEKTIGGGKWTSLTTRIKVGEPTADGIIGLIVRDAAWNQDPNGDRFITADKVKDNKVTVWLVTGDKTIYYNEEDAIVGMNESLKKKITSATFSAFNSVTIRTSAPITDKSVFRIKDSEGNLIFERKTNHISFKSQLGKTEATISMGTGKSVTLGKTYTISDEPEVFDDEANFTKCDISFTGLYDKDEFNEKYAYDGTLGAEYSASQTKFTVWSPVASEMKLNIYSTGDGTDQATSHAMTAGEKGTWTHTLTGDQKGKYYTYSVKIGDTWTNDIVDPYARSGGRNGKRGMIVDLASTNPTGWDTQTIPTLASNSEAVIWEAQLRDVTIHESSGVSAANRGKFLGLTENGTKTASGKSTALDYLKDLGVTQVHFQPLFDFASVDENFTTATYNKDGEYNWGYDPLNYNMPEGSYSSDPADGNKRVNEMKQMVMALHNEGIQIVMDVVYNHVSSASGSNFEKLMPGYYFRMMPDGSYYNGSGCGNETASDHAMFRKFMIDSVVYWATEYKIDGFRFDLMGLHDTETMNMLYEALAKVNPDVIVYGEGWTGGTSGLASDRQATLANANKMPNIALFNDIIRDGLKGSVFDVTDTGFISGKKGTDAAVYVGAAGATSALASATYKTLGSDKAAFAVNPTQNINYTACHDNSLLWDKLNASVNADAATLKAMNRLSAVSVFTSQGISLIPAGEELLRSKPTTKDNGYDNRPTVYKTDKNYYYSDNSYKSPDSVNAINWNFLDDNSDMVEFYKAMIAIKKTFPQFRLTTTAQISECLTIKDTAFDDGVAAYAIKDPASNSYAVVIVNANADKKTVSIPQGEYSVFVNGDKANATTALSTFTGNSVEVGARSAVVMTATLEAAAVSGWTYSVA